MGGLFIKTNCMCDLPYVDKELRKISQGITRVIFEIMCDLPYVGHLGYMKLLF